jgi:hypothetical protein
MPQILQVAAIAIATLGTGAATMSVMNEDIPDLVVPEGAWVSPGALDGQAFEIYGRDVDSGAVLEDELLFRDGTFQSVDCQNYCDFGWSDYQTKDDRRRDPFHRARPCARMRRTRWSGTVRSTAT